MCPPQIHVWVQSVSLHPLFHAPSMHPVQYIPIHGLLYGDRHKPSVAFVSRIHQSLLLMSISWLIISFKCLRCAYVYMDPVKLAKMDLFGAWSVNQTQCASEGLPSIGYVQIVITLYITSLSLCPAYKLVHGISALTWETKKQRKGIPKRIHEKDQQGYWYCLVTTRNLQYRANSSSEIIQRLRPLENPPTNVQSALESSILSLHDLWNRYQITEWLTF